MVSMIGFFAHERLLVSVFRFLFVDATSAEKKKTRVKIPICPPLWLKLDVYAGRQMIRANEWDYYYNLDRTS